VDAGVLGALVGTKERNFHLLLKGRGFVYDVEADHWVGVAVGVNLEEHKSVILEPKRELVFHIGD
jgi:hypothetical protein